MKKFTDSPEETIEFAQSVGKLLRKGDVIAYRGGLGAGKTTFTRGLCMGLGIGDKVTSPTYALVNEYRGSNIVFYHFDMYRIDISQLETTGFFDYPGDESVIAVEWSENIEEALPDNTVYITINRVDENKREIIIEGDERFDGAWD